MNKKKIKKEVPYFRKPFLGARNEILSGNGFFVSYNPMASSDPIQDIYNMLGDMMGLGPKSEETALCKKKKDGDIASFLILNGDFRKEYTKLVPKGYKACAEFFNKKKGKYKSNWSD